MSERLDAIANSYARHICKGRFPDGEDVAKAFIDGVRFGGENRWHFDHNNLPNGQGQIVGLFLDAPMTFDIHLIDIAEVSDLFKRDMLAWA